MDQVIPVIDIAPWFSGDRSARASLASAVDAACKEWGFLIVSGHGIDRELLAQTAAAARSFFARPLSEKLACEATTGRRGYHRFASGANARTIGQQLPSDLRESFRMGPEPENAAYFQSPGAARFFASNVWPDEPANMRALWERYYAELDGLSRQLMSIFAHALGLPDAYFDDKIDHAVNQLVAQHYPALDEVPLPGQLRNGEHTDFGSITLLLTEDRPGGLQILGTDDRWYDVKPVPGTFIVNLGDMLSNWTNDRRRSTMHRVANPPHDAGDTSDRLSLVFFHQPNYEAVIECIPSCKDDAIPAKYEPITAGDYFAMKLDQVHGATA
jgi:isopenicillin N synthase-like dioxygenase